MGAKSVCGPHRRQHKCIDLILNLGSRPWHRALIEHGFKLRTKHYQPVWASSPEGEIVKAVLDEISAKLQLSPTSCQDMGEAYKVLLNEMLYRIQSLTISDYRTPVYN